MIRRLTKIVGQDRLLIEVSPDDGPNPRQKVELAVSQLKKLLFDLTVNQTLWETMAPGDVVRFRLDVPDALRRLKLDVMGSKWATATLTRADGTTFTLFPGATGRTDRTPGGGEWLVDIRESIAAPRTKDVRFRSAAR